ncbi:MAG TPA: hypothetical protein VFY14_17480 [Streptomyces sp.]|nr:hypothetical protein [Streptomyces sp.]
MGTSRTVRLAPRGLATALTVCAVALSTTSAVLPDREGPGAAEAVRVTPVAARPGSEVELLVPGCAGTTGTARSEAFVADVLLAPAATGGGLFGEAAIRSDAGPGDYRITVSCAGAGSGTAAEPGGDPGGQVTVSFSAPVDSPDSPDSTTVPSPLPEESPVAPVPAGGGGTAEDTGPGLLHAALGLALAGAATLAAVWRGVLLRRRTRPGPDR